MSRPPRAVRGGLIDHVFNRANARLAISAAAAAFERVLAKAASRHDFRLLPSCVMPDHFQLVVLPSGDGDPSRFIYGLTMTHPQRWRAHRVRL